MTDEVKAQEVTEPTEEKPAESTEEKPDNAQAGNDKIAAQKYRDQRNQARADLAKLQEQIKALEDSGEQVKELKKQLDEQQQALAEAKQSAEIARYRSTALAQAGCIDIEIALPLLDEDGDVEALQKAKP